MSFLTVLSPNYSCLIREIFLEDGNVKDDVKMANKGRSPSIYGRVTPFIRHFYVVFDVPVLRLNLPNIINARTRGFISLRHGHDVRRKYYEYSLILLYFYHFPYALRIRFILHAIA